MENCSFIFTGVVVDRYFSGCIKGNAEKKMIQVRMFFTDGGFAKKEIKYEQVVKQGSCYC